MLDAVETGSAQWWLLRLGKQLARDAPRFDRLEAYWRGTPPLPYGNRKMREAYARLQRLARTNFGALISEAVLERMKLVGFRAGDDTDEYADSQAWEWWQQNGLDADSGLVHRACVTLSRSYVIVGEGEGGPLITVEDPRQVTHECAPTNRRDVQAALKTWWDDIEGVQRAVVYMPEQVHYFRSTRNVRPDDRHTTSEQLWAVQSWEPDDTDGDATVDNPLGEVPVVPFVNRPDMWGNGLGEFEDVLDVLDRINTLILDRMVVSAMQAYRQRWAKGVKLEDENGNETGGFDPGADLLWMVEDEHAQFGQFDSTDLTPIIKAIETDVAYLGAITRTPPHYLLAGIVNASGDALSVAETGLTSKTIERTTEAGESWERVYRLAAKSQGREIGPTCEVLWRDPQFRSLSERAAANVQLKSADVPWRTRMRLLDFTPTEIDRMEAERAADAAMMGMAQGMIGATPNAPGIAIDDSSAIDFETLKSLSEDVVDPTGEVGRPGEAPTPRQPAPTEPARQSEASWQELYMKARALGVRGASRMTKPQLLAVVGG